MMKLTKYGLEALGRESRKTQATLWELVCKSSEVLAHVKHRSLYTVYELSNGKLISILITIDPQAQEALNKFAVEQKIIPGDENEA